MKKSEQVIKLAEEGKSIDRIAKILGISKNQVIRLAAKELSKNGTDSDTEVSVRD